MCKTFCVVEARAGTHNHLFFTTLKCQNTWKSSLICVFLMVVVASKMIGNVLMKFDGAGYSFYFVSNFEVLKVTLDSAHGAGPSPCHFRGS